MFKPSDWICSLQTSVGSTRCGRGSKSLREDAGPSEIRGFARNAFCQAIDHELDWVSQSSDGAFDQAISDLDPDLYPTLDVQQHQVFAGVCAAGPASSALLISLAQECSDYEIPAHVTFVQQAVFPHWSDRITASYAWDIETLPLLDENTAISAVSTGSWLLVVEWISDLQTGLVQPQLDLVDAKTAQVLKQLPLPEFMPTRDANGNPRFSSHALISTADGVLLIAHDLGVASWEVEVVDGELNLLDYVAPDLDALASGHHNDGHFLYATYDGGLAAWVHDFGRTEPLLWQGSGGQEGTLQAFSADPNGALLAWMVGSNLVIEGRDLQGQSVWSWSLPRCLVPQALPNPRGSGPAGLLPLHWRLRYKRRLCAAGSRDRDLDVAPGRALRGCGAAVAGCGWGAGGVWHGRGWGHAGPGAVNAEVGTFTVDLPCETETHIGICWLDSSPPALVWAWNSSDGLD